MSDLHAAIEHFENSPALRREFAYTLQAMKDARDALGLATAETERLQNWVNDLQAGMYINCVYCGHRYGPDDEVPATMADVLKEHISKCPEHPMSAQTQRIEQFTDALDHIMRVCRNTDVQTKRLLWIEKRAQCAIEGSEEWREYDYPKVRKAAKENHELTAALEQKDRTIAAMEAVMSLLGKHLNVTPGDVPALLEAVGRLPAGDTRLEQIDREGEELQTMPLPTSPYPPDSKRRTWWCPMCHEKSDDDGIVRNHKKTCCHYDSALAPPAVACATQTDGGSGKKPLSDRLEERGFTEKLDRVCGNPSCGKRFSTRDPMQMYCCVGCKPPGPPDPPPGGPMPRWGDDTEQPKPPQTVQDTDT